MALVPTLIEDVRGLEDLREGWDALAVAAARPYCAPAWMLAWWRHVPGPEASLRAVAVHEGDELVALAPYFAETRAGRPTRYRVLAAGTSHRVEPVARPGREREAAEAIAGALASAAPRPALVAFETVDDRVGWAQLLAQAWPTSKPPVALLRRTEPAPTVTLDADDYAAWLQGKSRNFRSQAGRLRRRLEGKGAQFRLAGDDAELERGLADFARLHYARWEDRGGTVALTPAVERMLLDAGKELLASGRLRLHTVEVDGETISAHLFVAAGGEVAYWNGGFDERFAAEQPSMQALLSAVEEAFARGDRRVDLGGGGQAYKYRLADGEDEVESELLAVRDRGYPLTRLQLAPSQAKAELGRRLPEETRDRLRQALRRG
ncbi:MAG TPA: GNAT family N-acetyltransferase [Thermoleophilaceae bacterium]|nr:GNAT family N-acetyltransferase [Thermoleophilaceae bacterium]